MYLGLRFIVDDMVDVYVNETKIRFVRWHSFALWLSAITWRS
jgi:hypothetical protein